MNIDNARKEFSTLLAGRGYLQRVIIMRKQYPIQLSCAVQKI